MSDSLSPSQRRELASGNPESFTDLLQWLRDTANVMSMHKYGFCAQTKPFWIKAYDLAVKFGAPPFVTDLLEPPELEMIEIFLASNSGEPLSCAKGLAAFIDWCIKRVPAQNKPNGQPAGNDAGPTTAKSVTPSKKNPNDSRDKFAYTSIKAGKKSLQEIKNKINKTRKWEPLDSVQGVSAAARRYAKRHSLPWPIVQR